MRKAAEYVESVLPADLHGPVEVTSRYLPAPELAETEHRWLDDEPSKVYLIDVSWIRPALCCRCRFTTSCGPIPAHSASPLAVLFRGREQGDSYFHHLVRHLPGFHPEHFVTPVRATLPPFC